VVNTRKQQCTASGRGEGFGAGKGVSFAKVTCGKCHNMCERRVQRGMRKAVTEGDMVLRA
jgi:hypothetical protein